MTNRRFTLLAFAAVALVTSLSPASASAQNIWDRVRDRVEQDSRRDRNDRDRDRDRDPDWRRDRRDDDDRYGRNGRRISDYDRRRLRDLARRIEDRSRDFQRDVDRMLDNSRVDGTNREDRINDQARDFRNAAGRFRGVAGDSNDLYSSRDEARDLLERAARISRVLSRVRGDSRLNGNWNQLRNDLRAVADIYNLRFNDNGGYNGRW